MKAMVVFDANKHHKENDAKFLSVVRCLVTTAAGSTTHPTTPMATPMDVRPIKTILSYKRGRFHHLFHLVMINDVKKRP